MPGKQVKNWTMYEAMSEHGMSKDQAARITNAKMKRKPVKHRKRGNNG